MFWPSALPVVLALLLAGCLAAEPGSSPAAAPGTEPPPGPPPVPPSGASAGLRACLGPWTGRGSFDIVWPVAMNGQRDAIVVNVTEPDAVVSVWLDADPAYEGEAVFTPTDQPPSFFVDRSRMVRFNLTGDPAYGTGNLTAGAYNFTFQPDHGIVGRHTAEWTVEIREVPRLGAPNCRPAGGAG